MIGKSETGKRPIASAEALEILEERQKDGELGYEQKLAHEHIRKFTGAGVDGAKKLRKAFEEFGVSESTALKIADILPMDIAQLKHILFLEKKNFSEEDVRKMMELVDAQKGK